MGDGLFRGHGCSFLDANVLVYADAGDEPVKQERALSLIGEKR